MKYEMFLFVMLGKILAILCVAGVVAQRVDARKISVKSKHSSSSSLDEDSMSNSVHVIHHQEPDSPLFPAMKIRHVYEKDEYMKMETRANYDDEASHKVTRDEKERAEKRRPSKKLLKKVLWENQGWFHEVLGDGGLRKATQLFGLDEVVDIPKRVQDTKKTFHSDTDKPTLRKITEQKKATHNLILWHEKEPKTKERPEMISDAGYPSEIHDVITEDGYILQMHRIPYGLANGSGPGQGHKTPVYLQHGLLCSSADWVISGPGAGLAYILADHGYDVWMGNVRGNTYSKKHETLSPTKEAFWNFSWDQHGLFDVPAQMDAISGTTGQRKMFYIGHSMGTTMFWVLSNVRPEYKDRILAMFALAPVAQVHHMRSPVALLAPFVDEIKFLLRVFGDYDFLPHARWLTIFGRYVCRIRALDKRVCENFIFLICGYDSLNLNVTLLPLILGHAPAGTSTRTVIHYAQEVNAKKFQHYDFGKIGNLENYGTLSPPEYSIESVTSPVIAFWGNNDWLAEPVDVEWLTTRLPNLIKSIRVPFDKFNHLDFLWGIDAPQLVYDPILEMMQAFHNS
ncbi:unnamed protein product [Notodromas monacha]|uniref:Uncharacterized protein n=1 Tax=Notodromas monacha TaxID=399045 RepID=A0A7R9BZJ4_9CRUS|nr:unnamed protein product [Notodromas monacha]CAG0923224.1 unnamed protein product [Notodromas monacha]